MLSAANILREAPRTERRNIIKRLTVEGRLEKVSIRTKKMKKDVSGKK